MSPPSSPEEEAPSLPEEQEHRSSRPMSPAVATPKHAEAGDVSSPARQPPRSASAPTLSPSSVMQHGFEWPGVPD